MVYAMRKKDLRNAEKSLNDNSVTENQRKLTKIRPCCDSGQCIAPFAVLSLRHDYRQLT
jgi:hypothetical protein